MATLYHKTKVTMEGRMVTITCTTCGYVRRDDKDRVSDSSLIWCPNEPERRCGAGYTEDGVLKQCPNMVRGAGSFCAACSD